MHLKSLHKKASISVEAYESDNIDIISWKKKPRPKSRAKQNKVLKGNRDPNNKQR